MRRMIKATKMERMHKNNGYLDINFEMNDGILRRYGESSDTLLINVSECSISLAISIWLPDD